MLLQHTPYTFPALVSAVIVAALARLAWRRRNIPAAMSFALLTLCAALWSAGYVVELSMTTLPAKILAAKVKYTGAETIGFAWLIFVLAYTGREHWLTRRNLFLLAILPAITLLLVWSNEAHGLIWRDLRLSIEGDYTLLYVTFGAWQRIYTDISLLLVLFGFFLLLYAFIRTIGLPRRQFAVVGVGAFIPFGVYLANHLGAVWSLPAPGLTPPVMFAVVGIVWAWSLSRYRLLDMMPVLDHALLQDLDDVVILLDAQDRVVDLNSAAQQIIELPLPEIFGMPITRFCPEYVDWVEDLDSVSSDRASEFVCDTGDRYFDVRISSLNRGEMLVGRLLMLRDITARRQNEEMLQYRVVFEELISNMSTRFLDLDTEELHYGINQALQTIGEFVGADRCSVFQFDDNLHWVRLTHLWQGGGLASNNHASYVRSITASLPWWLEQLERRGEVLINRVGALPASAQSLQVYFQAHGVRSFVTIPLYSRDVLLGFLIFESVDAGKTWSEDSLSLFKIVGEIIASTLARKQAEAKLQKRNRDLALFNRAGQALTAMLDLQEVLELLLDSIIQLINAAGSSVWLWDEDRKDSLVCKAAVHKGVDETLVNMRLQPGQGIAGWVGQHGESVIANIAPDDERFTASVDAETGFQTQSLLAVPLLIRGETIGVLEVVNKRNGTFSEVELELTETLAASAAIAIDNAQLIESLRLRNEELDAFAHSVAHDLKNPLSVIVGHATMLNSFPDVGEEERQEHTSEIVQSGQRMFNIIEELLLLSSVRKLDEVDTYILDMSSILAQAQMRLANMIKEYQAEIIVPVNDWPLAEGYGPWIEEVWVNYLSNALKYGGCPPRVEVGADVDPDGMVRFWVRDDGEGLTEEAQARLFTPFTRLNQVSAKGHGLGLSIVKRIVEKLGGRVSVWSRLGEGSVFSFTLPADKDF